MGMNALNWAQREKNFDVACLETIVNCSCVCQAGLVCFFMATNHENSSDYLLIFYISVLLNSYHGLSLYCHWWIVRGSQTTSSTNQLAKRSRSSPLDPNKDFRPHQKSRCAAAEGFEISAPHTPWGALPGFELSCVTFIWVSNCRVWHTWLIKRTSIKGPLILKCWIYYDKFPWHGLPRDVMT